MNRKIRGVDARRKAHGPKEQITRIERLSFFLESVLYRDPGLAEREWHQLARKDSRGTLYIPQPPLEYYVPRTKWKKNRGRAIIFIELEYCP